MSPFEVSTENRLRRLIRAEVAGRPHTDAFDQLRGLCQVVARVIPATGAGISLMGSNGSGAVVAASDPASESTDELQFTLGEGPCLEAFATRSPVLVEDVGEPSPRGWSAYTPAAQSRGVAAVSAFPLQIGNSCLGVLDVYRDRPGDLSPIALDEMTTFARLALLDKHEMVSSWLSGEGGTDAPGPRNHRFVSHQATGFIMSQLGVSPEEAMLRIRAHAFASDRRISHVAEDIVGRRLTLDRDAK